MSINSLKEEIADEVSALLSSEFKIGITSTKTVPHSGDAAITFPNLDAMTQGAKLIETCVLYIDIRRSTDLNLTHRAHTVSRLYSAFVRAMIRCARYYGGHVRGIIGDRVMVIFDAENCFATAVNTAIAMNSVAKYIINRHFKANEVTCGIGIDFGKMLATKTGIRRHGHEQHNYRNLVWLGRAANVASKLTDLANKPPESVSVPTMEIAHDYGAGWVWTECYPSEFVQQIDTSYVPCRITPKSPYFKSFIHTTKDIETRPKTAPILMTDKVYNGFKAAAPDDPSVKNKWFKLIALKVPSYTGHVFQGDVIFTNFRP